MSRAPAESVTIREAAEMLGVHMNTVRRKVRSGAIRAEKLRTDRGEEYRIPLAEIESGPGGTGRLAEVRSAMGGNGASAKVTGQKADAADSERRDVRVLLRPDDAIPIEKTVIYEDLKHALQDAAALKAERDLLNEQLADAAGELRELRGRCRDADSRIVDLETERVETLSELEQVRAAYRRMRESMGRRWRK